MLPGYLQEGGFRHFIHTNGMRNSEVTRISLFLNKCLITFETWGKEGKGVRRVDNDKIFREISGISVNYSNLARHYFLLVFTRIS
jgi:hypothetical protein